MSWVGWQTWRMSQPIAYLCWYHKPRKLNRFWVNWRIGWEAYSTGARLGSIFSSAFLRRFKLKDEKRLLIIVPKMYKMCSLSLVVFNSVGIGVWLYLYIYLSSCFLFWSTSIKIWCEIYVFLHHSLLFSPHPLSGKPSAPAFDQSECRVNLGQDVISFF